MRGEEGRCDLRTLSRFPASLAYSSRTSCSRGESSGSPVSGSVVLLLWVLAAAEWDEVERSILATGPMSLRN